MERRQLHKSAEKLKNNISSDENVSKRYFSPGTNIDMHSCNLNLH